jgi:glycogen debranching enzyme
MQTHDDPREWLEADGLGGFASGTVSGVRTRRYHALLLAATTPPTGRFVLVNGLEAFVETKAGRFALSGQRYAGDVVHPDGPLRVEAFESEPSPRWTYTLADDVRVRQEVFVTRDHPQVVVRWQLRGDAVQGEAGAPDVVASARALRLGEERRRAAFRDPLERAADSYLVRRGAGRTIVAGYPWFTDWGRDTFIALRGLGFATGRHDDAKAILVEWAAAVSDGMLPNRFPDGAEPPEYNSVDAALWYVVAVHELLEAAAAGRARVGRRERERLVAAVAAILEGHRRGTRHGIRMDAADGLLAAGAPGVQLTWMDAKIGERVITPRIGKPVEVQALWLNALRIGAGLGVASIDEWERGRTAFLARFWSDETGALADVVDADHVAGRLDVSFRPNQVLAVGGLPFPLLEGDRARRVVDAVESRLVTPLGLRSLAPGEPGYRRRYGGGVVERDETYHQGTVWPWLAGPFVEAWVRVRGGTPEAMREARERFVAPLRRHLAEAGLGHVSEVADADAPHRPGGCPFQAWSLGELLRLERVVLADASPVRLAPRRRRSPAVAAARDRV